MQLGPLYRAIFRGTPFLAGLLVSLVGAAVLIGWQIGNPALTQIRPWLPAMRPLVAVGLMFCGVGLIARQRDWRGVAKLCAIAVLLVASSTLPQFFRSDDAQTSAGPADADSTVVASAEPGEADPTSVGDSSAAVTAPAETTAAPALAAVDSITTETGELVEIGRAHV